MPARSWPTSLFVRCIGQRPHRRPTTKIGDCCATGLWCKLERWPDLVVLAAVMEELSRLVSSTIQSENFSLRNSPTPRLRVDRECVESLRRPCDRQLRSCCQVVAVGLAVDQTGCWPRGHIPACGTAQTSERRVPLCRSADSCNVGPVVPIGRALSVSVCRSGVASASRRPGPDRRPL